jgi:hypothetical protein
MHADPGWAAAIKWGLLGLVPIVRRRVMRVRPAITAARSLTLTGIVGPIIILLALLALGNAEPSELLIAELLVGAVALSCSTIVLWLRYRPPYRFAAPITDPPTLFLRHAALIAAFATAPALTGFVGFFLGGGFGIYYLGFAVSLLLLLVPGRPTEAMADLLAAAAGTTLDGPRLWESLFDPSL